MRNAPGLCWPWQERAHCSLVHPAGVRYLLVTRPAVPGSLGKKVSVRPSACLPRGGEACVGKD